MLSLRSLLDIGDVNKADRCELETQGTHNI